MPPRLERIWRTVAVDDAQAGELARLRAIPLPIARVLVARGLVQPEAADRFLNPRLSDLGDPFLLPDVDRAVDRIWSAIHNRESVVVFGDYDVDGVTSTALLVQVLRQLGGAGSALSAPPGGGGLRTQRGGAGPLSRDNVIPA